MNRLYQLYEESKRRNVIKAGISYLVVSWVILQVVALVGGILNAPLWLGQTLLIALIALLPVWLIISWYYELTAEGLKKTVNVPNAVSMTKKTGQKLNHFIIIFLSLAVVLLMIDRLYVTKRLQSDLISSISVPSQDHAIAVLPFLDLSPASDQQYFTDGLSEELLNLLSKIQQLKVTSRTSSFSFKNSELPITTIAEKLGVTYVLEGSVRKQDNQIRITAQLINAETDEHLWSENFDRTLENVFTIQDQVARAVVNSLQLQLLDKSPLTIKTDPKVYALYLEASQLYQTENGSELIKAEELLHQALLQDADYTPAKVLLAKVYTLQANVGVTDFVQGNEKAIAVLDELLDLEPQNALAIGLLGDIALAYEWDFKKADSLITKSLKIVPTDAELLDYAANLKLSQGNFKEATKLYEYILTIDPLNPTYHYGLGIAHYAGGQLIEAENAVRRSISIDSENWAVHSFLSKLLALQNRPEEAFEALENENDERWRLVHTAMIYYSTNEIVQSNKALQTLIDKYSHQMAYQIAQVYAFRGEIDEAFNWLDVAYEVHDLGLNEIISEPDFRGLQSDPRWKKFIDKLGFYR